MSLVNGRREGETLVITVDNPPVNALGAEVRGGLLDLVRQGNDDPAVRAIVIRCAGKLFSGGADINEFGKSPRDPTLPDLVAAIEHSKKPVIAAINGTALGGGLELALGCHYRIAVPHAKLGLPEIKLGLLPGAGGTQRLPRVIGAERALDMIISGEPIGAVVARELGLVDHLMEGDVEAEALAFAARAANAEVPPPPARRTDKIADTDPGLFERYRQQHAKRFKGLEAPAACLKAVEAATTLPIEEGLAFERSLFRTLVAGQESRAMRHIFFAERAAARVEGLPPGTSTLPVDRVGIIGAGTMGTGIAMTFLNAGLPVRLVEAEAAALDRGVANIRRTYEASAAKGRLSPEAVDRALALLTPSLDPDDLRDCDLIVEAVFELMPLKKEVFRTLDAIAKPTAILASNTSYLNINEIAVATGRPEQVVGLHFFSPANIMKLLEVVRGARTSPQVLATAMALAKRIGKIAVVAGVCHGFIGNRMLAVRQAQASALLLEGARPDQVDRVLTDFGFPMGPFQMSDLAGLDIGWDPAQSSSSTIREVLCERGRKGQKSGKGIYDYDADRNRSPSAEVNAIIVEFASRSGLEQRNISEDEILQRLLYPMINEGALILEERIAQRPSDIDMAWVNGYGWPARTGGPMFWADHLGLAEIVAGLERHGPRMGNPAIAQLLCEKASAGELFNG